MDPLNQLIYDSVQRNLEGDVSETKNIDIMAKIYLGTATSEEKESFEAETNLTEEKIKEFCDIGYHFAAQMDKVEAETISDLGERNKVLEEKKLELEEKNLELEERNKELEERITVLEAELKKLFNPTVSITSLENLALNDQNYSRYL